MLILLLLNLLLLSTVQSSGRAPTWVLNDGHKIPIASFGTFGVTKEPRMFKQSVIWALEAGYRHIDTAAFYLNEIDVGEGIAAAIERGILTREELFVTTKLDVRVSTGAGVLDSIKGSLRRLKLDYVDLYLIHWPTNAFNLSIINDPVDIWNGMEEVKRLGLARSIGVSNYNSTLIDRILTSRKTPPAVNEIEINPTNTNSDTVKYCQKRNITVLGYASMGYTVPRPFRSDINPRPPPNLKDPLLRRIANKYGVSTSQVVLRNSIDRGIVPIVKSFTRDRIRRNIDLFGFKLTPQELLQINDFNIDESVYLFDTDTINSMCEYVYNVDYASLLKLFEELN